MTTKLSSASLLKELVFYVGVIFVFIKDKLNEILLWENTALGYTVCPTPLPTPPPATTPCSQELLQSYRNLYRIYVWSIHFLKLH